MSDRPLRLLKCSEAEADLYAYRQGREDGTVVRIIRGRRCSVLDRCMAEWAAALQFPYCFEGTWDSFRQSLQDLSWRADRLVLLISSADRVLPRAAGDFAELLKSLEGYAASSRQSVSVVLQADGRVSDALAERLSRAGVKILEMAS